tara:strand:+ start:887 stop:1864 length:978 start_codon:yes stop_codon:yes gene_type:complete
MPSPTSSLATQRPDLATFLEFDLESEKAGYIATQAFPVVDVQSQAGSFGKIPIEQLLQQRNTLRAPGAGYARGNFTFTSATYATVEHGAEEPVDDREAKMYAEYFQAEQISTMRAFSAVLRNAEARVAAAVFNTTTWTGSSLTTAPTNEWDDAVNAVPLTDVEAAVGKIYDNSGLWANALIINRKVFRNLRNCAQIIDRITASGAGAPAKASDVTTQMLAQAFDLDYVIVAGTSKNSATEGQAATPVQIWSNEYAMVCKIATSGDMREPCIGRTFHWADDGSSIGGTVETYRDESVRADIVRVRHDVDEIVLYPQAGHLLSNITT